MKEIIVIALIVAGSLVLDAVVDWYKIKIQNRSFNHVADFMIWSILTILVCYWIFPDFKIVLAATTLYLGTRLKWFDPLLNTLMGWPINYINPNGDSFSDRILSKIRNLNLLRWYAFIFSVGLFLMFTTLYVQEIAPARAEMAGFIIMGIMVLVNILLFVNHFGLLEKIKDRWMD